MHYIVNAQKGLTVLLCVLLMLIYQPANTTYPFIYMGLHGGYGIVWLIKDYWVPDQRFRQRISATTAVGKIEITSRPCSDIPLLVSPLRHHQEQ